MSRVTTPIAVLVLLASACGGGESSILDEEEIPPFAALAIADLEWTSEPATGFTTPFSFELIAPAVDGKVDVSYW